MGFVPRAGLLAPLLAAAALVAASPFPRDDLHDAGYSYLMMRDCDSYCGADNQMCCSRGETCTTLDGNVATCVGGGGVIGGYTTTWTETRTFTSTIQTYWAPAPAPTEGAICTPQAPEQEACGTVCCAGWQTCAFEGQCSSKPGYDEPSTIIVTTDGKVTTRYSAPYRITGTTVVTTTEVQSTDTVTETETGTSTDTGDAAGATQTDENGEPIGDDDDGGTGGGGLSAGAIAGIVIGSIAGVMLLCLIAFCCIVRGCWALIFGRKKEKRERVEYEESYYRGSRPPPPPPARNTGWFNFGRSDRPRSPRRENEKKDGSGKWWLGLAGAAATMLALLNLRKDKKKPERKSGSRSRYSDNSSYFYSDSSPSSASSRRTHRTRRTRRSDGSRSHSGYTRRPASRVPSRGPSRAPSRY